MGYIYDTVSKLYDEQLSRDPFEIADDIGIRVEYIKDVDSFSGMILTIKGVVVILINSDLSEKRQAEVCAHELGHYFLHRDEMDQGIVEGYEIFDMLDTKEYEANLFAAHLLVDEDDMLEYLYDGYTVFETSRLLGVNPILLNIKMTDMNRMGYNFPTDWSGTKLFN